MVMINTNRVTFSKDPSILLFEKASAGFCVKDTNEVTMYTSESFTDETNTTIVLRDQHEQRVSLLIAENGKRDVHWESFDACESGSFTGLRNFTAVKTLTQVNVYLGYSVRTNAFDLKIKGSWTAKNLAIYQGDTCIKLAQMRPVSKKTDKFLVKFYPKFYPGISNEDVASLFLVLAAMENHCAVVVPPVYFQPTHEPVSVEQHTCNTEPSGPDLSVVAHQYISRKLVNYSVDKVATQKYHVSEEGEVFLSFFTSSRETVLHNQMALLGADNETIVILQKKMSSTHERWEAYSCSESVADKKMLFSISKNHKSQDYTDLNVNLGKEKRRGVCPDFKVTGNWPHRPCTIYNAESTVKIAHMLPLSEMNKFKVEVYPNVDSAFLIAIAILVDVIESPARVRLSAGDALGIVVKLVSVGLIAGFNNLVDALS